MFKRLIIPVTTLAALIALFAVVSPTGASGQSRGRDHHYVNENVTLDQPVIGTVQVYGGVLIVRAVISGDLLAIGARVRFEGRGRVQGNVIHAGGALEGADGRVGGRIYPLASLQGAAGALTKNAIISTLLLAWLVVSVIVTLISGRAIRLSSQEVRASSLYCFVLGLVAITSFVLTAIAFSYLVPFMIGIPLLAALGAFAVLTKVYGMIVIFHAVGTIVAGARSREQLGRRKWLRGDLAMVVIGVLLLGALRLVPVAGTLLWSVASIFGVGVALATKFGRREPWFLQFRSAAA